MKFLLLLIVAVAAGAWFYPPYAENAPNACAALEKRMGVLIRTEAARLPGGLANDPRVAGLSGVLGAVAKIANGVIAETYVHDRFPQLPPSAGCVAAWWKLTFDPDLSQYLKAKLPLPR